MNVTWPSTEAANTWKAKQMKVSIVYDSGFGHTARQAQAVAEGVSEIKDAEAILVAVADGSIPWPTLEASDAIIFGSPTYNGLVSARFKQFMEDSTKAAWSAQNWRNKIAGSRLTMRLPAGRAGYLYGKS